MPRPPPSLTPFPVIERTARWEWPRAPFLCSISPSLGAAEPCLIEAVGGSRREALLNEMNPESGYLRILFGSRAETVSFSKLRRLTLTTPLTWLNSIGSSAPAEVDREYRLKSTEVGCPPMIGRTLGYVRAREGMYLFTPTENGSGLHRVFVPRSAYSDHQFGPFAEDVQGMREISDPRELLQAIERQRTLKLLPIGTSLLQLGLVTREQLDQALKTKGEGSPLGEALVRSGAISRADLERALAHKLGYPRVDLVHFPIDPVTSKLLTLQTAIAMRAVPLMLDGEHIVVAVSNVARANKLGHRPASAKRRMVPVLAPKNCILDALTRMSQYNAWQGVPFSMHFFATTS